MNEPSVFSTATRTLQLDILHYKIDGTKVEHRNVHNAYGALQQKSYYKGLLMRDNYITRPFFLTRSFFFAFIKCGNYWTGINNAIMSEVAGSMRIVMSLGV